MSFALMSLDLKTPHLAASSQSSILGSCNRALSPRQGASVGESGNERQYPARDELLLKAECPQVFDALRIEDAVEVIALMLHYAGVKVANGAIDGAADLVEAAVAQPPVTRHETA